MVTLYTWFPSSPRLVFMHRMPPDFGHSTLQVIDENGQETYVSFWPELDSLYEKVTHPVHPRPQRYPSKYAMEIDPELSYMRREAERSDRLEGLSEERIIGGWQMLRHSRYDVKHWNCSNITRFLILHAMDPAYFLDLQEAAKLSRDSMTDISNLGDVAALMEALATRGFIDSVPEDTVALAEAYNAVQAREGH